MVSLLPLHHESSLEVDHLAGPLGLHLQGGAQSGIPQAPVAIDDPGPCHDHVIRDGILHASTAVVDRPEPVILKAGALRDLRPRLVDALGQPVDAGVGVDPPSQSRSRDHASGSAPWQCSRTRACCGSRSHPPGTPGGFCRRSCGGHCCRRSSSGWLTCSSSAWGPSAPGGSSSASPGSCTDTSWSCAKCPSHPQ